MLTRLDLRFFKCFELLKLPLGSLTLLSGGNASGKSSVLQALVLLHQTMREHEWSTRLLLNGASLRMGAVTDVVDKVNGRYTFEIGVMDDEYPYQWAFTGERSEMSMAVDRITLGDVMSEKPEVLHYLLPPKADSTAMSLAHRLRGLTYLTAERVGPREVYPIDDRQSVTVVGPAGEHAVSVLHQGRDEHVLEGLALPDAPPTRLHQVEERMRIFFPGCGLAVQQVPQTNAVTLGLRTSPDTDFHRPIHAGFGLTQVLPIIVAALSATEEDIILIENPEVHLHPAGQALMGQFLTEVARSGVQVIVETHSDHILNGIRRSVRAGKLLPDQVAIHFFDRAPQTWLRLSVPSSIVPAISTRGQRGSSTNSTRIQATLRGGVSKVDFLVNDLSLHGQFLDLTSFRGAVERLMAIRQIARRFGRALYCHRNIAPALVTPTMRMPQMVQMLRPDERRALLQWLTQQGPFWEDARHHEPQDWLEWNGNIVTDTAIGEAAWCCLNGIERALVSLMPSNWQFSPVPVDWVWDAGNRKSVDVANHWDPAAIESVLQTAPVPMASWDQLKALASARCTHLTFTVDAFAPLNGHPFVSGAAQRLLFVLDTLNHFKSCFDVDGQRTPEGHEMYRDYFTGRKGDGGRGPLFTDSSDDEKRTFETEMTFKHPTDANKALFCPWHGKVQTPQLRVHFSWPVRVDEPLYIVYVGPKITKR